MVKLVNKNPTLPQTPSIDVSELSRNQNDLTIQLQTTLSEYGHGINQTIANVSSNTSAIATNVVSISANASAIVVNANAISANTSLISANTSVITEHTSTLAAHTSSINILEAGGAFSVHRNGTDQTSAADSTFTKVQWTTKDFDPGNEFDSATNYRFTPDQVGKYLLTSTVMAKTSIGDAVRIRVSLYKNGSEHKRGSEIIGSKTTGSILSTTITAVSDANGTSDYFEVFFWHNNGTPVDIDGTPALTHFSGSRVKES